MKLFAALLAALALLAGLAGGFTAFSSAANPVPTSGHVRIPHLAPPQAVKPAPVVRWAPCQKPAVLEGHACVVHIVHTVELPPPAASAVPQTPPTATVPHPSTATAPANTARPAVHVHHEDGGDHGDEGRGGYDD
jgi:hypothetical protein